MALGAPLHAGARLKLRPLVVTSHDREFLVGDPVLGEFVALPEIGVVVLDALRAGRTLGEAASVAAERAGGDVDVHDFATTLIDLGFVSHVDDVVVGAGEHQGDDGGRWDGAALVGVARPLFSPAAWAIYGALLVASVAALIAEPALRPDRSDLFFAGTPLESVVAVTLVSTAAAIVHEGWHWLTARVQGVPARVRISRRLYLLVLETDLSALWSLPRRRRLGPLLAGMAFDTLMLSVLLAARITANAGAWDPPASVEGLLAALVLAVVIRIAFQSSSSSAPICTRSSSSGCAA